jgi:DNA mismatch endonuclease (patch repair protein)
MQTTLRRDTPAELAIRSAVHRLGFRYRVDLRPDPSVRGRADLVFTAARVAVYVDGCFWHSCPEHGTWPRANAAWWRQKIEANVHRDRESDRRLTAAGWLVLRFWEHEDPSKAARVIAREVRRRRGRSTGVRGRS